MVVVICERLRMNPPSFVPVAVVGASIAHAWDADIGLSLMRPLPDEHVRLASAFRPLSERSAFAALLATAEWVVWRLKGHADLQDALMRLEAAYAALVDARYGKLTIPRGEYPDPAEIHGPLDAMVHLMAEGFEAYAAGAAEVKQSAFCMALVARHVLPDAKVFEKWLSATLRTLAKNFPDDAHPIETQPAMARATFDGGVGSGTAAAAALDAFLQSLDPSVNKYLEKRAHLKKLGLPFEPYRFE
jgi:hypothetical protein